MDHTTGTNSEFTIKYRHDRSSVLRLNPIGRKLMAPTKAVDQKLDVMAYVIHCTKHDALAVYQDPDSGIKWLPFTPILPDMAWTESAIIGAMLSLCDYEHQFEQLQANPPFDAVQLLEIQRVQLPQTLVFLTRLIFYMKLDSNVTNFKCCHQTNFINWHTHRELACGVDNLWGPELVQYARLVSINFDNFEEHVEEFSLDDVYLYSPRDPPRNAEERLLSDLNISEKTIEILYNDVLDHCWPCFSLPVDSFKHYLSKYGFRQDDPRLNSLFVAFNYTKTGFVTFHELLIGLVLLEPQAIHHDTRIKFVFRFYDLGSKGYLDKCDFDKLVADMGCDGENVEAKSMLMAKEVGLTMKNGNECITFGKFLDAVLTQRLRGTSKLCRSSVPVFLQLSRAFIRRKMPSSNGLDEWKDLQKIVISRTHKGVCIKCQTHKYKLATHAICFDQSGYINKIVCFPKKYKSLPIDKHSAEFVFNPKSVSNVLLGLIRDFAKRKGNVVQPRGLLDNGPTEHQKMHALLETLVNEAKMVLKTESRLPNLSSPCYVIGDIHGNLEDLLTLEKVLWRAAPCLSPNFLFLGDYVDRGKWGFECAVYLIALKLIDPSKFILLRGNHEVRALQEKYSYKNECLQKYGPDLGERMWMLTNELFDMLPVAATIDSTIFCTHGGLSPNAQVLTQLRVLPAVMDNPEQQSKIAWELLWSDPCHMQQYIDIMEITELTTELAEFAQNGFVYNSKRGAAYLFNEHAARTFLRRNGLSHMIRAHEVPPRGYAHHFQNLVTTVFSCSHYCNNENEAAVILVDGNCIRAIRIDTHNNAPATDK